jgi:peptide/nickel transport system substrate-binding protein
MATKRGLSRREFLRAGAGGLVGMAGLTLLAACQPQAPAPPGQPTTAPAAPAAGATAAPAAAKPAAPAKPETKIGANLIGKLEGPEILPDARRPPKLGEAPMLADLVKAGKLPPVDQRVPLEPMVIKPLQEIGKYGGTLRRGFTGPADDENGNRWISTDKLVFWDYTGTKFTPCVAKSWEFSDGGRTFTLSLRKGQKWSDGEPFTADDFVFWYQDIYLNKELKPTPDPTFAINGKQGSIEKVDETTVRFKFPDPYPLFLTILGGTTFMGSGWNTSRGFYGGAYAPAHYLKKFLPKYAAQADLDQMVQEAKVDSWTALFKLKSQYYLNPDLPTLGPWRTTSPNNTPTWVMERNPYYYAVDTEGNQLPYIDKLQFGLAENLEVLNLRAIAGEYDFQERHTDVGKIPVFLESQQKGGYTLRLDPGIYGSDATLQLNQTFEADPEIARWLGNRDFRHALALGIDRDQLNETFWLGVGVPGNVSPDETSPYSPGPGSRQKWATLDVKQANDLLDKLGLDKKDAEGFRQRTDGKGRLRLEMFGVAGSFVPFPRIGEMIGQQWRKVGIQLDVTELERNLAFTRMRNNEHQIFMWANDGSELIYAFPRHAMPVDTAEPMLGPLWAKWFATDGEQGKKPSDPEMLKAMDLLRAANGQDTEQSIKTAQEIWKILTEETWSIGTVGISPAVMGIRVVKNNMGNIPAREMNAQHCRTPSSSHPSTFFFKS